MNCLYCGVETGTGGSHTSTPACLAALSAERDRLKREVLQRGLAAVDGRASMPDGTLHEHADLGRAKAGSYGVRDDRSESPATLVKRSFT
jgi:hypothetical protein